MTAHLLGTWPAGSPEWHEARTGKMTGSRIAAAAGLSPYESPFSLYFRMLGEISEAEVTAPMEWGTRLESAVFQKFCDEHPEFEVTSTGTWQHDERTWQTGNPDGLISDDGLAVGPTRAILEVKTARTDDGWGEPGTDQIPVHYRAQVLWYLDTLGLPFAYVAVLIGGFDYREYVVDYDEDEAINLRKIGAEFLHRIENGIRPDIDYDTATYEAIKELHPDIDPVTVEISEEVGRDVIKSKVLLDFHAMVHQKARSQLADEMGNAHYAHWHGIKIADRRAKKADGSFPYIQLAPKLPSLEPTP